MSDFYLSSVSKLKIRHGGVVDDILPPHLVSLAAFVQEIVIPQVLETIVSSSSFIPLAPKVTSGVPFVLFPADMCLRQKILDDQTKRRQPPIVRMIHPCPRMRWMMRWILGGLDEARKILLRRFRIAFSKIEEHPEPLFLLMLVNMNTSTFGLIRTS
ncbi:hypothetical protein Fot_37721 [Forsythia ovata]|uniref:Uncharacterized protein n=1 Tax=Forsythia ovata TaxID=205694 RepID=A0ABD1S189_9LAMI